jgi:hypothetical protein
MLWEGAASRTDEWLPRALECQQGSREGRRGVHNVSRDLEEGEGACIMSAGVRIEEREEGGVSGGKMGRNGYAE